MSLSEVTPREFETLMRRVEQMDQHGTRGVAGVAIQLANAIGDIADLRADQKDHIRAHEKERADAAAQRKLDLDAEEKRRVATRRFRWTATAAWLLTVASVVSFLIDLSARIHG